MGARHVLAPLITATLLSASAAAEETTVIYTGVLASAETAGHVSAMLALLSPPVHLTSPPTHLDEIVSGEGALAFGAELSRACAGDTLDAEAYRAQLKGLYQAIWETDNLEPLFELAHGWQTCLVEPVTATELARVSFIEGVMAHEYGDTEQARAAFAQVFAIEPSYAWETEFGPGAQQLFNEVATTVAATASTDLVIQAMAGSTIWVDGRVATTDARALLPGRHLVQLIGPGDKEARSIVVNMADTPVSIIDARALECGEGSSPESDFLEAATALFLGLQHDGEAPAYLVQLGEETRVLQWTGQALESRKISRTALAALSPSTGPVYGRPTAATPVMLAVGGGLLAGGTLLAVLAQEDLDEFEAKVETGELHPFPEDDDENPEDFPLYLDWQTKNTRVNVGYVLIAAGGATLVVSVPVGVFSARADRKRRELELNASVLPGPARDGRGLAVSGFQLTLTLR